MLGYLLDRFGGSRPFPALKPDQSFIVVGDIHGRHDLLDRFLDLGPAHPVVFVGDYVDRGEHSAEVLTRLVSRPDLTCLSGNHEEMLLAFLDAPEKNGARWLRYGGLQTLASFGVAGVSESSSPKAFRAARDALKDTMGAPMIQWLRALPTRWQSGNVAVVHAGADPSVAIADQSRKTLHWGHPEFDAVTRRDGVWVVHGHTIVDHAVATNGRIAVDTGAYATGRLSAVLIEPGKATFEVID